MNNLTTAINSLRRQLINGGGLLHIETSALIVAAAGKWSLPLAVVVAVIAGISKEYYDKSVGGPFDWKDLICDAIGILVGVMLTLV